MKRQSLIGRVAILLFSFLLFAEIGFAFPIDLKDSLGNTVKLKSAPRRIISLAPSITETLFAIGAGDKVVGVTTFDDYPPEVKRIFKVGGFSNPNLERILYLKPDLVLGISNIHAEIVKRLRKLKVPCFTFKLFDKLSKLYYEIEVLGKLTGREKSAENLVKRIEKKIYQLREKGRILKKHPRVFMAIWDNPLVTIGRGSYIHELIEIAGGKSITSSLPAPFPLYSIENLAKESPDIIVVAGGKGGMSLSKERVLRMLKGRGIKAVEEGNVYEVEGNLLFRLSPRIVDGINALYEIFRRWAEKD